MKTAFLLLFILLSAVSAMDTVSTPVTTFQEKSYGTTFREWSSDGTRCIEGCTDGKIRISRVSDTSSVKELAVSPSGIWTMRLTPDRAFLMVFATDSTLYRVDLSDNSVQPCRLPPLTPWQVIAFSYDGQQCIGWSSADSSFTRYNLSTGESSACLSEIRGTTPQLSAHFTPDGKKIFSLIAQNSLVQMRATENDAILFSRQLADTVVTDAGISFSSDGRHLALPMNTRGSPMIPYALVMETDSGTIVDSMQLKTGTRAIQLNFSGRAFSLSHDGTKLLAGNSTDFAVYDLLKHSSVFSWSRQPSNYAGYRSWFSPDDNAVFTSRTNIGSHADSLVCWDSGTKQSRTVDTRQEWPDIIASTFSAEGPVLIGKYRYDQNGSEKEWDSLVYLNPLTNSEMLPRKFLLTSSSYNPYPTWFSSDDGTMLYERIFHYPPFSTTMPVGELSVYSLKTGGERIYSHTADASQVVVAQDRRHLCLFDTSSCTIVTCGTFDSTKKAAAIPSEWIITTVDLDAQLVCAFKTTQRSDFDTVRCTAGIWSLATGANLIQFPVYRYSWLNSTIRSMSAAFLPDGVHLVFNAAGARDFDSLAVSLFDIRTGNRVIGFAGTHGHCDMALTPDRRQVVVGIQDSGICCYDALSGVPQRFFTTPYQNALFLSDPFTFNPSNPRQFIAGRSVWELPEPLAVKPLTTTSGNSPVNIVSFTRSGIVLSGQQQVPVTLRIIRPDGRQVVRVTVPPGAANRRFVPISGLADGLYIVRIASAGSVVNVRRIIAGRNL